MPSVPTLWTVFVINLLALGLVWPHVARSYPSLRTAPFWTGSAFAAASRTTIAMLRFAMDSMLPLLIGSIVMIFRHLPRRDGSKAVRRPAGEVARRPSPPPLAPVQEPIGSGLRQLG